MVSNESQMVLLQNASLILEKRTARGAVLVKERQIAGIYDENATPHGLSQQEKIDLNGAYLSPGFLDIHIHGSAGVDVQDTDTEGLEKVSRFLLAEGVTGFLATFVPTDDPGYRRAISSILQFNRQTSVDEAGRGARILGIHFEGPFVNQNRCGALHTKYFRNYDGLSKSIEVFTDLNDEESTYPMTRVMTLAPETSRGIDLIQDLASRGVKAFIGHSEADPELLDLAIETGAGHITHFPNALNPLHHRKPGAVGWGLLRDDVTIDCIADFHHVHPLMLRLMYKTKTAHSMALISDAIMPAGLGDGDFTVWGDGIVVRNGRTSLARAGAENTIAGSVITMRSAVKNVLSLGVPIWDAIAMATITPARIAGIDSKYGALRKGLQADLVAFDENLNVKFAMIDGSPRKL